MNDPEFVKRMDAFFEQTYPMQEDNLRQGELAEFWKKFREQVKDAYKDSDKWTSFYNIVTTVIDDYEQ